MDHLNTETQGELLLSLKVSFCTVACYEEEIKAREPFLADLPECKAGELGSWSRKQHGSRTEHTIRSVSFAIFCDCCPRVRKLFAALEDIHG